MHLQQPRLNGASFGVISFGKYVADFEEKVLQLCRTCQKRYYSWMILARKTNTIGCKCKVEMESDRTNQTIHILRQRKVL